MSNIYRNVNTKKLSNIQPLTYQSHFKDLMGMPAKTNVDIRIVIIV